MTEQESRPDEAETMFEHACQLKGELRRLYLDDACRDDASLRAEIESMISARAQQGEFLADPTVDAPDEPITSPGDVIGRYKLREQLGSGGFGVVWAAEQTEPVHRKVALKIIKPGMDTRDVIARFEAERQALAMMDHQNIARVLDAGATEQGRPYFVMELIRGVPITQYCDENKATVRDRLDLFVQVCRAVQHAHQKGIIHRDIKPSNVLVTLRDGVAVPKVIDFGIAKALSQRLTDKTVYTRVHQAIGTLAYMSPEAAELSDLDMDTRADIYGLGVLLYELLTGTTPFDAKRLEKAALHEACRIIREEEPPKASTRLSTMGERATAISAQRRTDPRDLTQSIRGDIDWILLKSLEKDRTRRYETASALAVDVQRFLKAEPVVARPPSTVYRMSKFVRRNRTAVAACSLIIVSLVIGILGTTWKAVEAHRTLVQLQSILIERGLLQALASEEKKLSETMRLARQADVPLDWQYAIEGCAALHGGDAEEANRLLKMAISENPENVSALAMLSISHVWNGDWASWSLLAEKVLRLKPRDEYRDFDTLFLAYARFYEDQKAAAEELDGLLVDKPTWLLPHAFRATAWGHAAVIHENASYARKALEYIRGPMSLAGENMVVKVLSLGVYSPAMKILGEERTLYRSEAASIVAALRQHPEHPLASHMCALHYQVVDDRVGQKDAWEDVLQHGPGFLLEGAIAAMYRLGYEDHALAAGDRCVEAEIGKSYILAASPDSKNRQKAYATYVKLSQTHKTWYVRHKLLQLLLLLERTDEAKGACATWISTSEGIEHFGRWEQKSIEFVANFPSVSGFSAAEDDAVGRFFVNYQHAFLAMAERDLETALKYFRAAAKWSYPDERRQWACAFAERLSQQLEASDQKQ